MDNNRNPQVSATVDPDLYQEIDEMAKKNNRTLSKMVAILLESAVKERKRKRKNNQQNEEI